MDKLPCGAEQLGELQLRAIRLVERTATVRDTVNMREPESVLIPDTVIRLGRHRQGTSLRAMSVRQVSGSLRG